MPTYCRALVRFLKDEAGPTAVEYAILLALLVTICVGVLTTLDSRTPTTADSHPPTAKTTAPR